MNCNLLKKIKSTLLAFLAGTIGIIYSYFNTSTFFDFTMCTMVIIFMIILGLALEYYYKKGMVNFYIMNFSFTISMYICFYTLNLFFIRHVSHLPWIGVMVGTYLGGLRLYNIKFSLRKFLALVAALTIIIWGMFNIFDDNILGVNKVERAVKTYLIKDENYSKNDFEQIFFQQYSMNDPFTVAVRFKDEPNVAYIYKVIKNKAVQIKVDAGYTNKTEYKHIENENVYIQNKR